METEMKQTGEQVKYENGKIFNIYSKMTAKGIRYYRYSKMQMRFFPISKIEINNRICLDQMNI